ncbi:MULTISPECIES: PTS system mannose/fructose/sorbose family transporter subunit IID [Aerococcus]|uniref:PTS system mannose/fructose/sorbose family transporter subunit IID n=1 Tax=Aerococcus tenax TaxID=3078812 RepID=A0A5N1BRY7_9LACT|nr:PTS system mannose/fructose/sorbose family transporter subunit IID [Aerococcus urinae]KAA9241132.1 PTS system mannose/fructose/sorbose family transporter subunit IID [Aerococcus urinae]MDK6597762.1 PTS system mannose/fructose/sorbose family transporter subunit IID [Aerococcus urinae]MDK7302658.1 PTS system mannose/fructose/sorbose family transporter subunit IID [Aerococcus urinae]MDK7801558.1 PTS system mannose/fructose/sorbose family transporter subunit IID [Aerococcus urinae]MDK8654902.1 
MKLLGQKKAQSPEEIEDKKMLRSMFWRSWTINMSRTGAYQYHAIGLLYTLLPAINRFYKTDEEKADALVRHTTWYNATMHLNNLITGIVAAMERSNAESDDFDPNSITAVKTSLMGPISGIGDSFFWGILRVIAAGIGISIASTGSPLGAIIFLLLYNIPAFLIHYYMLDIGYSLGTNFIRKVYESGAMKVITKASSMLGLMMVGSMTASHVKFKTTLSVAVNGGGDPILIQEYLDQLFKGLVPMAVTLLAFYLIRNKRVNVNWIMLGIILLSVVLGLLGVV